MYLDKSNFPYQAGSDIKMYGRAFYLKQPILPKKIGDRYQMPEVGRGEDNTFWTHTRQFTGMLSRFLDHADEDYDYSKLLSETQSSKSKNELDDAEKAYVNSGRSTPSNRFGIKNDNQYPSVYLGDYTGDGIYDPLYAVEELVWSLLKRRSVSGRYVKQVKRDTLFSLRKHFFGDSPKIDDVLTKQLLAVVYGDNGTAVSSLDETVIGETKSDIVEMLDNLTPKQYHELAVLLAGSQHLFFQGRHNLFGRTENDHYVKGYWEGEGNTQNTIESRRRIDQHVFSRQFDMQTDPLSQAMSAQFVFNRKVYRQQYVSGDDIIYKVDGSDPDFIKVSRQPVSRLFEQGAFQDVIDDSVVFDTLFDGDPPILNPSRPADGYASVELGVAKDALQGLEIDDGRSLLTDDQVTAVMVILQAPWFTWSKGLSMQNMATLSKDIYEFDSEVPSPIPTQRLVRYNNRNWKIIANQEGDTGIRIEDKDGNSEGVALDAVRFFKPTDLEHKYIEYDGKYWKVTRDTKQVPVRQLVIVDVTDGDAERTLAVDGLQNTITDVTNSVTVPNTIKLHGVENQKIHYENTLWTVEDDTFEFADNDLNRKLTIKREGSENKTIVIPIVSQQKLSTLLPIDNAMKKAAVLRARLVSDGIVRHGIVQNGTADLINALESPIGVAVSRNTLDKLKRHFETMGSSPDSVFNIQDVIDLIKQDESDLTESDVVQILVGLEQEKIIQKQMVDGSMGYGMHLDVVTLQDRINELTVDVGCVTLPSTSAIRDYLESAVSSNPDVWIESDSERLSDSDKIKASRVLAARDDMQTFLKDVTVGAMTALRENYNNDDAFRTSIEGLEGEFAVALKDVLSSDSDSAFSDAETFYAVYQMIASQDNPSESHKTMWAHLFSVAELYRVIHDSEVTAASHKKTEYQSLYTTTSAGWRDAEGLLRSIRVRSSIDYNEVRYTVETISESDSVTTITLTEDQGTLTISGAGDSRTITFNGQGEDPVDVNRDAIVVSNIYSDRGAFTRIDPNNELFGLLKSSQQTFENAWYGEQLAAKSRNERVRDAQKGRCIQWNRQYEAWKEEQRGLLRGG